MSDLPEGWEWATLAAVCASIADGDHQAPPQSSSGVPFLVIGNIRNHKLDFVDCRYVPQDYFDSLKSERRPQKGDVLYSLVGSYGIPAAVLENRQFCVQRHIGILRPSSRISQAFLTYVLRSRDIYNRATECATGTAQLTVPLKGLRRIRIPLPSLDEQSRIVTAIEEQLSCLDAGLAALGKVRGNLAKMRASVISSAVTGRSLTGDMTPGQRNLPSGWSWRPLGEVITSLRNGVFVSRPVPASTGPAILRISAVRPMALNTEDVRYVPDGASIKNISDYFVDPGDLLFTRYSGSPELVGACAVVPDHTSKLLHPDKLIRVKVNHAIMEPRFMELAAAVGMTRQEIRNRVKTTAGQTGISGSDLKAVPFPVPPVNVQRQIVEKAEGELAWIRKVEESVMSAEKRSSQLRSSILSAAFSGKLTSEGVSRER